MVSTEAHRYELLKGIQERTTPTIMSSHGGKGKDAYGESVEVDAVTQLLAETQPAALTGGTDKGRFGYEKLREHYANIRNGTNKQARQNIMQDIVQGFYTVGTAVHQAVALIKSRPSAHEGVEALPTPPPSGQEPRAVWIETIAVISEATGRGIGSALLHDVLGNYPEEAQVICQVLGPYEDNPVGDWLEDRLGFELDGQSTRIMWDDTVGSGLYLAESVREVRTRLEDIGKFTPIARTAAA